MAWTRVGFLSSVALAAVLAVVPSASAAGDVMAWRWDHDNERFEQARVEGLDDVVDVDSFFGRYLAVRADGTVWEWGVDKELAGIWRAPSSEIPMQVAGVADAVQVAAGVSHSLALLRNGTVLVWGSNQHGDFGDGTREPREGVHAVPGLANVTAIASHGSNWALLANGTVMHWPLPAIGAGAIVDSPTVVVLDSETSEPDSRLCLIVSCLSSKECPKDLPCPELRPTALVGPRDVVRVSAHRQRALLLDGDGRVWQARGMWPAPEPPEVTEVTLPDSPANVTRLATDGMMHIALRSDGSVVAWGEAFLADTFNFEIQVIEPHVVEAPEGIVDVAMTSSTRYLIRSDGALFAWGRVMDAFGYERRLVEPLQQCGLPPVQGARGDRTVLAVVEPGAAPMRPCSPEAAVTTPLVISIAFVAGILALGRWGNRLQAGRVVWLVACAAFGVASAVSIWSAFHFLAGPATVGAHLPAAAGTWMVAQGAVTVALWMHLRPRGEIGRVPMMASGFAALATMALCFWIATQFWQETPDSPAHIDLFVSRHAVALQALDWLQYFLAASLFIGAGGLRMGDLRSAVAIGALGASLALATFLTPPAAPGLVFPDPLGTFAAALACAALSAWGHALRRPGSLETNAPTLPDAPG